MALWVAVHSLADGTNNDANTLNRPIFELVERTNYLYDRVQGLYDAGLFESVRISSVILDSENEIPVVGDVVYRNPANGVYGKATATMQLADYFTVADTSFALGILVAIDGGGLGTVLLSGRCPLITGAVPWVLADRLEPNETFRPGPYYLSSITAGRITAYPSGPRIYIGNYFEDYALVNPQYRDTGEAHVHRTYALYSQPAGTQVVTDPEVPSGTHALYGFNPDTPADPGDRVPRLVITGSYLDTAATAYTLVLGGATQASTPTGFDVARIYWSSSDPVEGSGSVRVPGFEIPLAIGTKGLMVTLENPDNTQWDIPYSAASDTEAKRTWSIDCPDDIRGWLARRYRIGLEVQHIFDNGFSVRLMGGPAEYADARIADTITATCPGRIYTLPLTEPALGDTTVIDTPYSTSYTFEYTDDGTVTEGNIPVVRTGDATDTGRALAQAILATGDALFVPVVYADGPTLFLGAPADMVIRHLGVAVGAGVNTEGTVGVDAKLLVFDQDHESLLSVPGYWATTAWSVPVALTNGLSLILVPYAVDGTYRVSAGMAAGDSWQTTITDEAPGAKFQYALGTHPSLNQWYPPIPMKSAAFVLNGVELDQEGLFDIDPTYRIGVNGLYWYSNAYGMVPWPADWTSRESPGSNHMRQNAVLHFVRNSGPTGVVTSLQPAPNSPITVRRCGTPDPATVGDLEIDVDFNMTVSNDNLSGYQVVKNTDGRKLRRGPVVERVVAGPGIEITQPGGQPAGQGTVTIGLAASPTYTGDFEEVALQNAKEEVVGMFPYIRLLPWKPSVTNVPSGFIAKFRVPQTVGEGRFRVLLYATMFGEIDVPAHDPATPYYAGVEFSYSFLPDLNPVQSGSGDDYRSLKQAYQGPTVSWSVPLGDIALPTYYTTFDPILVHNDNSIVDTVNRTYNTGFGAFPRPQDFEGVWPDNTQASVRAGTLVGIRIQRTGVADQAYQGGLGFLNLKWKLVPVT